MLGTGNWITPLRDGLVPSKPLLHHWIAAFLATVIGLFNEGIARLPALLAASLMLFVTCASVLRSLSRVAGGSSLVPDPNVAASARCAALWAVGILGTTYGFINLAFDARVDMVCAALMALAISRLLDRLNGDEGAGGAAYRAIDFTAFFIACGLAVLAKGPLGIVLPLFVCVAATWYRRGILATVKEFSRPRLGWVLFLAIVLPWYISAYLGYQRAFVGRQVFFENVQRFFGGEEVNSEAWWFYGPSFLRIAAPWSILFLIALFDDLRLGKIASTVPDGVRGELITRRTYLVAFLAGLVFFSIAAGKRHSYLLPLFPLYAQYLALWLRHRWGAITDLSRMRLRRLSIVPLGALVVLSLIAMVGLWILAGRVAALVIPWPALARSREFFAWALFAGEACFALTLVLSLVALWSAGFARALSCFAACSMALSAFTQLGLGMKSHLKGWVPAAACVNRIVGPTNELVAVRTRNDELLDPLLYYINREVQISDPDRIARVCPAGENRAGRVFILGRREKLAVDAGSARFHQVADLSALRPNPSGAGPDDIALFECSFGAPSSSPS